MVGLSKTERIGSVEKCKKHLQQISTSRQNSLSDKGKLSWAENVHV